MAKTSQVFVEISAKADKLEKQLNDIKAHVESTARGTEDRFAKIRLSVDSRIATMQLNDVVTLQKKLRSEMSEKIKLNADFGDIQKTKAELDHVTESLRGIKQESGGLRNTEGGTWFRNLASSIGLVTVALGALNLGKKVLEITSSFQDIKSRLENMYGSVEKGTAAFEVFKRVAASTPYSLREVAESGATLKAFGMDAEKNIKIVADLAAYMGVSIPEAASAWGRAFAAGAGAADIFRERGVLNVIKSFKGIDDLTKVSLPEFRAAMVDTFSSSASGIAGATDKISKNLSGMISNMGDNIEVFLASIGNKLAPAIGSMAQKIGEFFSGITPKDAVEGFFDLKDSIQKTETEIVPLIGRYEELKGKANLNTKEQTELSGILDTITAKFPEAISQWDNYGRAIGVSTEKLKELIEKEKERLKYANREAIQQTFNDYAVTDNKMKSLQSKIKAGGYEDVSVNPDDPGKQKITFIKYSSDEIARMQGEVKALGDLKKGMEAEYKRLTGQETQTTKKSGGDGGNTTNTTKPSTGEKDSIQQVLDKEKELRAEYEKVNNALNKANLTEFQRNALLEERLKLYKELTKYDKSIDVKDIKAVGLNTTDKKEAVKYGSMDELKEKATPKELIGVDNSKNKKTADIGLQNAVDDVKQFDLEMKKVAATLAESGMEQFTSGIARAVIEGRSLSEIFKNIGSSLAEMAVQMTLMAGLKSIFAGPLSFLGIGAHNGGEFVGTSSNVLKMASGGSFTVPQGYNNDSFPLMVESGERVSVTPASQVGRNEGGANLGELSGRLDKVVRAVEGMHITLMKKEFSPNIINNVDGESIAKNQILPAMNDIQYQQRTDSREYK